MSVALIEIDNLKTYYFTREGVVKAVDGINLDVGQAQSVGIAGESGCGKTTAALSILRILPAVAKVVSGRILFDGEDLVTKTEAEIRKIRWKEISIIPQGAMNALDPVHTITNQIAEPIIVHEDADKNEARERAHKLLDLVGVGSSRGSCYPHELSGGTKQRAMIAMALACNPKLIIADEPTTALDVMIQAQILKLIRDLQKELGLSIVLISHDLSIITETCDQVAIMYAGKIVESAGVTSIFNEPAHPYTQALMKSIPDLWEEKKVMKSIPGNPPNLVNPPSGCRFHPRCPCAIEACKNREPEMVKVNKGHYAACLLMDETQRRTL